MIEKLNHQAHNIKRRTAWLTSANHTSKARLEWIALKRTYWLLWSSFSASSIFYSNYMRGSRALKCSCSLAISCGWTGGVSWKPWGLIRSLRSLQQSHVCRPQLTASHLHLPGNGIKESTVTTLGANDPPCAERPDPSLV